MKYCNYLMPVLLILLITGCSKNDITTMTDQIQNEKGWYITEYKRPNIDNEPENQFVTGQPYMMFGVYGSGFKMETDGTCFIHYYNENMPIEEKTNTIKWEAINFNEVRLMNGTTEDTKMTIIQLTDELLWIKYKQSNGDWEYKLKPVKY